MESKRYYIVFNPACTLKKDKIKVVEGRVGLHYALSGAYCDVHYQGPFYSKPSIEDIEEING
jgi:hypothetical protein